jgi:RimJ/RimL family protein N-acetyltransferase
MTSERLRYQPVELYDLDAFHCLVQDEHVRRYLMDGNVFPREWTEERIHDSRRLFERRGVGIWLAHEKTTSDLVGFCGFLEIPSVHPEPQLVYAMFERFTGNGYATEMARASIAQARTQPGFAQIIAAVDEVNTASVHVLRKLGFDQISTEHAPLGNCLIFKLGLES